MLGKCAENEYFGVTPLWMGPAHALKLRILPICKLSDSQSVSRVMSGVSIGRLSLAVETELAPAALRIAAHKRWTQCVPGEYCPLQKTHPSCFGRQS